MRGTYGYGCQNKCGYCKDDAACRVDTGECICHYLFDEPTCHIPKNGQILKDPPTVIQQEATWCKIELSNMDFIGKGKPSFYLIQYKEVENNNSVWTDFEDARHISKMERVNIMKLNSSTQYAIRILISNASQNIRDFHSFEKIPYTVCKTTCNEWTAENIEIIPLENSTEVVPNLSPDRCKSCKWELQDKKNKVIKNGTMYNRINITNLQPYTEYKISFIGINNSFNKKFKTYEGQPNKVKNLRSLKSTTTSINLIWERPENLKGDNTYYEILFKKNRTKNCKHKDKDTGKRNNSTKESAQLTDLEPFFIYKITIYAVNGRYKSQPSVIEGETLGLDYISQDEGIENASISLQDTSKWGAKFLLSNLPCTKLRGLLIILFRANCLSKWCTTNSSESFHNMSTDLTIKDLQPFSNYSYSIGLCRSSACIFISNGTLKTKATSPNKIEDFLITSQGKNYIRMRWIPPYPPTGILDKYKIITTCEDCKFDYGKENYISPKNCTIWPKYHCAEVTNLIPNGIRYTVMIQARNQEPNYYVDVHPKESTRLEESESDPPGDLNVIVFKNNSLFLTWKYPNRTNGDLKTFQIHIISSQNKWSHIHNINKYTLNYKIWVKQILPSSLVFDVQVIATNKYNSTPAIIHDSTYPSVPSFINPDIRITNYTKTTISISLDLTTKEDKAITGSYLLILITEPFPTFKDDNQEKLEKILNITLTHMRVVAEINLKTTEQKILNYKIGDQIFKSESFILNATLINKALYEGHKYNVTVIGVNEFKNKYSYHSFYAGASTSGDSMTPKPESKSGGESSGGSSAYALLLLLLLIPIVIGIIMFRRRIKLVRSSVSSDKILDFTCRSTLPSSKDTEEDIPFNNRLSVQILPKPVMKVKPKLSIKKSTNPPNSADLIYTELVKITDFEEYVKTSIENGELENQHALFPRGQTQPWNYGSMKVNKPKNRYNNLIAYDHSRVKLEKIPGDEYSDYINASYIHGYNVTNAFIATQGPKPATLVDFWRMIWQENVKYIVMLANIYEGGKKKVEQYWPNINEELTFGEISVEYQSMDLFADYEYRIFHVVKGNETRKLEQLHFTTWPDHGVPLYSQSLVPFIRKILKIPLSSMSPVVVHCSAGVGRTGTILLTDISLRMAAKEGAIDMLNNLQKLREQRPNMVDNMEQYKLVHLVVLETLMGLSTSITCNDNMEKAVEKLIREGDCKIQLNYLTETEWQDQAMKSVFQSSEEFIDFPEKNRFQHITPENQARIFLTRYPQDDESSSYINAVYVDGFRCPKRFIVTQQPMPNTLGDFWRLVVEKQSSVIVSLNEVNLRHKTCCKFWPTSEVSELHPIDFITVTFGKKIALEYYDIYSVHIKVKRSKETEKLDVQIICFKGWPSDMDLPTSCEEFLSFWEETEAISRRSAVVIVTCFDGSNACGIYVALSFVIEKMKLEQECDVCLAVRNVRHNRNQFISSESQFIFIYEAAVKYINGFQSYANFQNQ